MGFGWAGFGWVCGFWAGFEVGLRYRPSPISIDRSPCTESFSSVRSPAPAAPPIRVQRGGGGANVIVCFLVRVFLGGGGRGFAASL